MQQEATVTQPHAGMLRRHAGRFGKLHRALRARANRHRRLSNLEGAAFVRVAAWCEDNRRPRAIYEAAGWRVDGTVREKTYLGVTFREVRYRIAL